jgi:hypothetical protein
MTRRDGIDGIDGADRGSARHRVIRNRRQFAAV